jgi:hypothetical protein
MARILWPSIGQGKISMTMRRGVFAASFVAAAIVADLAAVSGPAHADQLLGSYVARLSDQDHHASDGYALDTAAQVIRQDRANFHKFHQRDGEDSDDPWFASPDARARLERMLNSGGAMNEATRSAVFHGSPIVRVDVYRDSVRVEIIY